MKNSYKRKFNNKLNLCLCIIENSYSGLVDLCVLTRSSLVLSPALLSQPLVLLPPSLLLCLVFYLLRLLVPSIVTKFTTIICQTQATLCHTSTFLTSNEVSGSFKEGPARTLNFMLIDVNWNRF